MTREDFLRILPELTENYEPAADVAKQISGISLLMMIGPSGVGKTTLINCIDVPYVPADTTRVPRDGEEQGVDYFFQDDYEKIKEDIEAGKYVQVAIGPTGDFYATRAEAYPGKGPAVYAVVASVVPIFRKLGFKETISAFITPPSYQDWMNRIKSHGLSEGQLRDRLKEGKKSLEFALNDGNVKFILNDDVDSASSQIMNTLDNKIDKPRETEARYAAESILKELIGIISG
jgi:guanylate kinase